MKQFNNNQIKKKIIEAKNKLKNLSLDYKKNFINIEKTIGLEVEEIEKCIAKKEDVIPEIDYNQLISNSIEKELIKLIKKRGWYYMLLIHNNTNYPEGLINNR